MRERKETESRISVNNSLSDYFDEFDLRLIEAEKTKVAKLPKEIEIIELEDLLKNPYVE